jgi:hypothetical protein
MWPGLQPCRDGNQGRFDVTRLVPNLGVGEAQRRQAGGGVGLIAQAIACLLTRRAVIPKSVGLDDQSEIRPVKVDFEAVQLATRLRERKPSAADDR